MFDRSLSRLVLTVWEYDNKPPTITDNYDIISNFMSTSPFLDTELAVSLHPRLNLHLFHVK